MSVNYVRLAPSRGRRVRGPLAPEDVEEYGYYLTVFALTQYA